MRVKYFLPCQCGNQIPVDTRQAGQEVRCDCGTTLEVPTMRGVTALERVEVEVEVDKLPQPEMSGGWGVLQGVAVMGGVLMLLGCALFVFHRLAEPRLTIPDPDLSELTPIDSFYAWQDLRSGPMRDLGYEKGYLPALATNRLWQFASLSLAIAGTLTLAGSMFALRGRRKGPRSSARREDAGTRL